VKVFGQFIMKRKKFIMYILAFKMLKKNLNSYIFIKNVNLWYLRIHNLNYKRSTTSGGKDTRDGI